MKERYIYRPEVENLLENRHEREEKDKRAFIKAHWEEIMPTLRDVPELETRLEKTNPKDLDSQTVEAILEKFRVKIFFREKEDSECEENARRIGLSVSDPLTEGTTRRLIERLQSDRRCRSIMLVADNVGGVDYEKWIDEDPGLEGFQIFEGDAEAFPDDQKSSTLAHIGQLATQKPVDVALVFLESKNNPSGSLLFEWKSAYGAGKLYLVNEGWNGIGQRRELFKNIENIDESGAVDSIDGIFCVDELARDILADQLRQYVPQYAGKIEIMGLDPLPSPTEARDFRQRGRDALGIEKSTIAFSYFGDVPGDFYDVGIPVDPAINVRTLENIIEGVSQLAMKNPETEFALLVRPHPRDGREQDTHEMVGFAGEARAPNLRIIDASRGRVQSGDDVTYAGDAMLAIDSTANFFSPKRGRESVFLGFMGEGLGQSVLELTFGKGYRELLSSEEKLHVVDSPEQLAAILEHVQRVDETPAYPRPAQSATDYLLERILGSARTGRGQ